MNKKITLKLIMLCTLHHCLIYAMACVPFNAHQKPPSPFKKELDSGKHPSMLSLFNATAHGNNQDQKINSFLSQLENENITLENIPAHLRAALLKKINAEKIIDEIQKRKKLDGLLYSSETEIIETKKIDTEKIDPHLRQMVKEALRKKKITVPRLQIEIDSSEQFIYRGRMNTKFAITYIENNTYYDTLTPFYTLFVPEGYNQTDSMYQKGLMLHELSHLQNHHGYTKCKLATTDNKASKEISSSDAQLLLHSQEYEADTQSIFEDQDNAFYIHHMLSTLVVDHLNKQSKQNLNAISLLGFNLLLTMFVEILPSDKSEVLKIKSFNTLLIGDTCWKLGKLSYHIYQNPIPGASETHPSLSDRIKNVELTEQLVKAEKNNYTDTLKLD